jgi:hypothetical protein
VASCYGGLATCASAVLRTPARSSPRRPSDHTCGFWLRDGPFQFRSYMYGHAAIERETKPKPATAPARAAEGDPTRSKNIARSGHEDPP